MGNYWAKTPLWLKKISPCSFIWEMPAETEPTVYITFDDGPHPRATPYVLEQLEKYNAKATFFCVGNNVAKYPDVYAQTLQSGHATGNHTYNHLNGWKTDSSNYLRNIELAKEYITGNLFRPPYGKLKLSQIRKLKKNNPAWKIIMWDILSMDFDKSVTPQQCLDNVLAHIRPGSIIIFHDSEKAWDRMSYALPHILEHCAKQNWKMKAIPK